VTPRPRAWALSWSCEVKSGTSRPTAVRANTGRLTVPGASRPSADVLCKGLCALDCPHDWAFAFHERESGDRVRVESREDERENGPTHDTPRRSTTSDEHRTRVLRPCRPQRCYFCESWWEATCRASPFVGNSVGAATRTVVTGRVVAGRHRARCPASTNLTSSLLDDHERIGPGRQLPRRGLGSRRRVSSRRVSKSDPFLPTKFPFDAASHHRCVTRMAVTAPPKETMATRTGTRKPMGSSSRTPWESASAPETPAASVIAVETLRASVAASETPGASSNASESPRVGFA
jgi:hypothetical protein